MGAGEWGMGDGIGAGAIDVGGIGGRLRLCCGSVSAWTGGFLGGRGPVFGDCGPGVLGAAGDLDPREQGPREGKKCTESVLVGEKRE